MRERLEQEGVAFKEAFTVDIDRYFWDPSGGGEHTNKDAKQNR